MADASERRPPLGVTLLAVAGVVTGVLSVFGEVAMVLEGGVTAVVGVGLLVLSLVQVVVLLALLELAAWAWYGTVLLYAFGAGIGLLRADLVATVVSTLVAAYVYSQKSVFLDLD